MTARTWKACAKKWRSIVSQVDAECMQATECEVAAKRELRALTERVKSMRAILVYARDQLDHLAKFHGYDLTLLRQAIVKLLGDPAPDVGSTFADVLAALDAKGGAK